MLGFDAISSLPISALPSAAAAAGVYSPLLQGMGECFIAFHDGTIDPTMHKIETGISA